MDTVRICKKCGQPLPAGGLEGLCPECLARVALGSEPAAKPDTTLTTSPEALARVRYFGDYELLEEIARGGMGIVWKARQTSLNRAVAIKMILTGELASEAEVQRFRREAEAAANLQHPNIVAIHEVGEHDGQHYYSMDYVEGRDLGTLVRESGPMAPAQAAECLKTIAEAVHFAHQRGTLHRDLKPQNVLMDAAGQPRITDFGLAKLLQHTDSLTESGAAMGSPSYMPPEQAAGHLDQIAPHSDVYSLGAILYELVTGRPPFREETAVATMHQVMETEPVAPRKLNQSVPPDLETICLKCLEKNPERRYHSARALAEDLTRFLNHEPIQARPVSAIRKAESWMRRNPWTLMAVVSLVAMVLLGLLYWQYERVKFLENHSGVSDQSLPEPVLWVLHLETWHMFAGLANITVVLALLGYRKSARQNTDWRQVFDRSFEVHYLAGQRPMSERLRLVYGLIGVAVVAFTVLYFAKLIQFTVWEKAPRFTAWLPVYTDFYFSLTLLFLLVRDYQQAVHGAPSRTLTFSSEQNDLLRRMIFEGDTAGAIKLYRRTVPDASFAEARDFVRKLAAELRAKQPEKFAPPRRLWDLNWRLMGLCLVVEAGAFAGIWLLNPPVSPATMLLVFTSWFLSGAVTVFLQRLKNFWIRFLGLTLCFLLPGLAMRRFYDNGIFLVGFIFGMGMIISGFTPKRRKLVPGKIPPDMGPSR